MNYIVVQIKIKHGFYAVSDAIYMYDQKVGRNVKDRQIELIFNDVALCLSKSTSNWVEK